MRSLHRIIMQSAWYQISHTKFIVSVVGRPVQGLNTLEVKDSELESSLVALEHALRDLDAFPDVDIERAVALAAREDLQQRVAAQQALEDTMASVRGISKAEGVLLELCSLSMTVRASVFLSVNLGELILQWNPLIRGLALDSCVPEPVSKHFFKLVAEATYSTGEPTD